MKIDVTLIKKVLRYYHTLKHLKWIQIKYQLLYRIFGSKYNYKSRTSDETISKISPISLDESIASANSYLTDGSFKFLNIEHKFRDGIDWNFNAHGKLWVYNLNYFEYLSQSNLSKQIGLRMIHDFIAKENEIKDGMESYPISLRIIFWIKFLVKFNIDESLINQSLFKQIRQLSIRPEYHLMGNHLLENGFGLLFGGAFFNDNRIINLAKKILEKQLEEQILSDGAHFELSPMYHQILLYRILDSINLLNKNPDLKLPTLLEQLHKKAVIMLAWLEEISFKDGSLPMINDSIHHIAPRLEELKEYANKIGIESNQINLKESGYRKMQNDVFELFVDVGQIGPDYIPGHAHSDTFNFVLHYNEKPLIVDTGVSTYEKNQKRNQERSTSAHNTVMVDGQEQSEVWGGFRVARRAKIVGLEEDGLTIKASHDGYQKIGVVHSRTFSLSENEVTVLDEVSSQQQARSFLHFHPDVKIKLVGNEIVGSFGKIRFENEDEINLESYGMAEGFNITRSSQVVIVIFKDSLKTLIIGK